MRKVIASEFLSLDGVFEAPDRWHFPYFDEEMGQEIGRAMAASDAMLMGRLLYQEWAEFWPKQDPEQNPVADRMNGVQKYVVSTTLEEPLGWRNSTQEKPRSHTSQYRSETSDDDRAGVYLAAPTAFEQTELQRSPSGSISRSDGTLGVLFGEPQRRFGSRLREGKIEVPSP